MSTLHDQTAQQGQGDAPTTACGRAELAAAGHVREGTVKELSQPDRPERQGAVRARKVNAELPLHARNVLVFSPIRCEVSEG
jgi:hypothetical protein